MDTTIINRLEKYEADCISFNYSREEAVLLGKGNNYININISPAGDYMLTLSTDEIRIIFGFRDVNSVFDFLDCNHLRLLK